MPKKLLFVFCLIFNLVRSQDKSVTSENIIQWQEGCKLDISDFQKERDINDSYTFTAYKIEFYPLEVVVDRNDYIQGYKDLTVVAEFHMNESHFHPDYEADLLKFEQLTFDIAELFARKIRKKFEEMKTEKERRFSAYQYEYNVLLKACRAYQSEFRKATNSGWESQKEINTWEAKIHNELNALQKYSIKPL
ncbi:hypothetical protein C1T31_01420 [Hanstruepera neustonica]|uniref:Uncharacterized protein n=1 Tax=Hanstruepera neustonica TaxID=1445657 RepID=A0A2K1E3G3_9FLAO|nr:hypothetical protein C1T31_01420 [Hanstruepera neustonica]